MITPPLPSPDMATWDQARLEKELQRFEEELKAVKLAPFTLATYMDNTRRFLRWRVGEYVPKNGRRGQRGAAGQVGPETLAAELAVYRTELHLARLARVTIQTYLDHPARFLRWLVGDYRPGSASAEVTSVSARQSAANPDRTAPTGDWLGEAQVQAAIVGFLLREGWTIDHQADTAKRERGIDVEASRGDDRLAVEVKGFPGRTYARGPRAGQPKPTHPSLQASNYFAGALLSAISVREADPGVSVAIGLPDVPRYRDLIGRSAASIGLLGIALLLVEASGTVAWREAKEFHHAG